MPYIKKNNRIGLDLCIDQLVNRIRANLPENKEKLTSEEFLQTAGDINYCFSRICAALIGDISYGKIAIATGVLENVKQELYRRVAEPYENLKILENGDIIEYLNKDQVFIEQTKALQRLAGPGQKDEKFNMVDKNARQFEFEM